MEGSSTETAISKKNYTRNQWFIFLALALLNLTSCMVNSIQAPIFPGEAEKRNATASEYGVVFGCFSLTQFIMSPIFGTYGPTIGTFRLMSYGSLVVALSTVLFGCLQFVNHHWIFISAAFVLRIIEAVGTSGLCVSIYSTIPLEFPDAVAKTIGSMEGIMGLAFSLGPFFGSALFQYGGFLLPFAFLGFSVFFSGQIANCTLRKTRAHPEELVTKSTIRNRASPFEFFSLMRKVPTILFYNVCVFIGAINMGFFEPLLEAHLEQFHLASIVVGLVFLLLGVSGAIGAPVCSHFCAWLKIPELVLLFGSIVFIIGFTIVGPVSFLDLNPSMYLTLGGCILIGIGYPSLVTSGFILSMKAVENSKHDGDETDASILSSQISGLWLSCVSLGFFLGPIAGGVLYDHFKFRTASIFIIVLDFLHGLSILIFILWNK